MSTTWQRILKQNFKQWDALADFLELNSKQRDTMVDRKKFPLNLPIRLANKIPKKTLNDPLLKQFLPTLAESEKHPLYIKHPTADHQFQCSDKLLKKYNGRALLVCTQACAMHCRYCFRQNFNYQQEDKSFEKELDIIRKDTSLFEVILSGGDPLSLSNTILGKLLKQLDAIPHIRIIRFHTRFPIGIPERIDSGFLKILGDLNTQVIFVIHCNHAREMDSDIFTALKDLRKLGIPLLNQSVLLKDVNDDVETLKTLSLTLIEQGILPYYIHQLDLVEGANHFYVPIKTGKQLIEELATSVPGYAVPKYVQEIPGNTGKTPLL